METYDITYNRIYSGQPWFATEEFCFYGLDIEKTGEKLQQFLSRSGYSVHELSRMIGVSNQTIYKWFHGVSLPTLNNLYQMSRLFECSMDELVAGGTVSRYEMSDYYIRETNQAAPYGAA